MNDLNLPQVLVTSRGLIFFRGKLLLIRRNTNHVHNIGKWEFPGGKLDSGETLSQSLTRETKEETGKSFKLLKNNFLLFEEFPTSGKFSGFLVLNIIGLLKANTSDVNLSDEHDDYCWVNFRKALQMDLTDITRLVVIEISSSHYLIDSLIRFKALSRPKR